MVIYSVNFIIYPLASHVVPLSFLRIAIILLALFSALFMGFLHVSPSSNMTLSYSVYLDDACLLFLGEGKESGATLNCVDAGTPSICPCS